MPKDMVVALCAELALPQPAPEATGGYTVPLPDGFTLRLVRQGATVTLSGVICTLPENPAAADALCRFLLGIALGRTLSECTNTLMCLCVVGKEIVLRQQVPADTPPAEFVDLAERFVNVQETWSRLAKKELGVALLRTAGSSLPGISLGIIRP